MEKLFEVAASVSTPLALGGFLAAVLFYLFKQILTRDFLRQLTSAHSADVIKLIIDRLFILALIAMVLGFIAYLLVRLLPLPPPHQTPTPLPTPASSPASGVPSPPSLPRTVSQDFQRRIGDDSSCTERNQVGEFMLCLSDRYRVLNWTERANSVRNGSASVDRDPQRANCVKLTLRYSDSGRGPLGDCRGNGWADYTITVNGDLIP